MFQVSLAGSPSVRDPSSSVGSARSESPAPLTQAQRNQLIMEHHPMVRAIAGRMIQRLPAGVDVDELVNIGVLGLIEAIERFDASRGVPLRAYAEVRIRGAMVDALRKSDWTPRAVRRSGARIDEARAGLRKRLGRDPDRNEMADALDIDVEDYDRLLGSSEVRRLVSLDQPTGEDGEARVGDAVAADDANVLDRWEVAERHAALGRAIEALPERERFVVTSYYQRELTLREIGAALGVTESRVSQILSQAHKRLQAGLVSTEVA